MMMGALIASIYIFVSALLMAALIELFVLLTSLGVTLTKLVAT
jgi:hypothetical protein